MEKKNQDTKAFKRFQIVITRTNQLLKATTIGIANELEKSKPILEKFSDVKMPRGRVPQNYEPQLKLEKNPDEDTFTLEIDDRSAAFLKKAVEYGRKGTDELRFHHNSIMLVYLWGSFETYIFMLFEELFSKKPEMLKSSESISYKTAIENQKNIIDYLIQNELERIGHFSLDEYLKYLERKINLIFPKDIQDRLRKVYLIRNIVAHNTGIVASALKKHLPKSVKVNDNELRISATFIENEIKFIKAIVSQIEKNVNMKFNKNDS
jgi:hypothetical protein